MTADNDCWQWLLTIAADNDCWQWLLTIAEDNDCWQWLLTMTADNDCWQWLLTITADNDCWQWLLTIAEDNDCWQCVCMLETVNPFPHTTNLQQTPLKTTRQKHRKTLYMEEQYLNRVEKSCLLQRRQKVSIWGTGLKKIQKFMMFNLFPLTTNLQQTTLKTLFNKVEDIVEKLKTLWKSCLL